MKQIISMAKKAANSIHRSWRRLQVFVERGTPTSPVSREVANCSHCGHEFVGNYCPRCGQHRDAGKGKPHFLKTFREAYPQLSSNFLRTIINLAIRPGYMIRDYFRGHRVLYQNPVSTFLIAISIVALCNSIFGPIIHGSAKKEDETVVGLINKVVSEEIMKDAARDSGMREAQHRWKAARSMDGHRRMAAALRVAKEKLTSDVSLTLFALFPILGSISYLVFRKRDFYGRRLTIMEHYVIFVYLYAFFSFIDNLDIIHLFYIAWAYRGIYHLSWIKSIACATLVCGLTILVLIVITLIVIALMLTPVLYYYNMAAV